MKLNEIAGIGLFEAEDSGKPWTDEDLDIAYKYISKTDANMKEINDMAQEIVTNHESFKRTSGSAVFALTRMHTLIHGTIPDGVTAAQAKDWFNPPKTMRDYASRKGHDVEENIIHAKSEVKRRPVKVKEPQARQMMLDYYHDNASSLPSQKKMSPHRTDITRAIMNGKTH